MITNQQTNNNNKKKSNNYDQYTYTVTKLRAKCKYCHSSEHTMKHGFVGKKQRWWCVKCDRRFTLD